jgi:L-asparagine transporter-like permease
LVSLVTPDIGPGWHLWLAATICCYIGIIIAIPKAYYNGEFWGALIKVPMIFVTMLLLLFKLKGANKKFIHTPHIHSAE